MYSARHAAFETPRPASVEQAATTSEFISPEAMQDLVIAAMRGRVERGTGKLLPIEEERVLINGPDYMLKPLPSVLRHDVVLPIEPQTTPYHDGGQLEVSQKYSVKSELYNRLVNFHAVRLGAAEVERLTYERLKFEESVNARTDLESVFATHQSQDAYHVVRHETPAPGSDGRLVSPMRVYVPGGEHGVRTMRHFIDDDADFAGAKIWVPQAACGEQPFRQDTPILTANTLNQLRSIVDAVRATADENLTEGSEVSPVGIPIAGAPGVFAAQPKDKSFNGEMSQFWAAPIQAACNALPLQAGDMVTYEWIEEAARQASIVAREHAASAGRNPDCHALLAEQDIAVVMNTLQS